ncbi:SpaA isopeptide-forming pilin-related protein [Streptomyces sp. NPDC001274]
MTTGGPGENDHTYDFGFRQQEGELRLIKHDQDGKALARAKFQLWKETNGSDELQTEGTDPDTKVGEPCVTGTDGLCHGTGAPGTYYWQEVSPPKGYAAPDVSVFGPLVLTAENLDDGVSVTAVNKRLPGTEPTPTASATPGKPGSPGAPGAPGTPGHTSGSGLAATGTSPLVPLALAGCAALTVLGAALVVLMRRRRAQHR